LLRIDGYVADTLALSKSFSADTAKDQFLLQADDAELTGDGSDATRLVFQTADQFGAVRPFAGGEVHFALRGPGVIVGDNPFRLTDSGGVGAIWIKTTPKSSGRITIQATHSFLGTKSIVIRVSM
jgi:beta-galactosidase